jgi:hypothetical protein
MKTCTLCNQVKQDTDFGYRSRNPDKRHARCRICMRPYYRKRHQARLARGWKPTSPSPAQKTRNASRHQQFHLKHPERQAARSAVRESSKRGERMIQDVSASLRIKGHILLKPPYCPMCGKPTPPQLLHGHHHKGYDHPLDVIFMCQKCHAAITALERETTCRGLRRESGVAIHIRNQRDLIHFSSQPPQKLSSPVYNQPTVIQQQEKNV